MHLRQFALQTYVLIFWGGGEECGEKSRGESEGKECGESGWQECGREWGEGVAIFVL